MERNRQLSFKTADESMLEKGISSLCELSLREHSRVAFQQKFDSCYSVFDGKQINMSD